MELVDNPPRLDRFRLGDHDLGLRRLTLDELFLAGRRQGVEEAEPGPGLSLAYPVRGSTAAPPAWPPRGFQVTHYVEHKLAAMTPATPVWQGPWLGRWGRPETGFNVTHINEEQI